MVVLAGLLVLLSAAPAMASTRGQILKDCQDDGQLQGSYSPSELRDARKNLPTDLREYSDCEDVLRRAELPQDPSTDPDGNTTVPVTPDGSSPVPPAGGAPVTPATGTVPSGAPAAPVTPQDTKALGDARNAGSQPVTVLDRTVIPVATGLPGGDKTSHLPGALVVALVLLALAGLALAIPPMRRRWNIPLPPGLNRS
jgi:hypothetical protein